MARLLLVLLLLANLVHSRTSAATPLEQLTVGFLGVGKIGSAVARGYCCQQPPAGSVVSRPRRVVVSPRSVDKAQKLLADFPDLVEVAESNAAVVAAADVVFVGLLPATARAELPTLPFRPDQLVISMMAAVDLEEVLALVRLPRARVVRTVPLPSNARRSGPILVHPAGNDEAEALLRVVGCPVVCATEAEMKPLVSLTGHISSFFELQRQTQAWAVDRGVDSDTARAYVAAFYSSLAAAAEGSAEPLAALRDEAATPGGLNEQSLAFLGQSAHFALHVDSLQSILDRLNGAGKKP